MRGKSRDMQTARWTLVGPVFCLVLSLSAPLFAQKLPAEPQAQGLDFSHALHLDQPDIGCSVCHISAAESQSSSDNNLPKERICLACHERKQGDTCLPCHTDPEHASRLSPRKWTLHFNHSVHVRLTELMLAFSAQESDGGPRQGNGEVAVLDETTRVCLACHRGMTGAGLGGIENYPTMKRCLACHEEEGDAMSNCATCHLPEADLFPTDHESDTFFDDHSAESARHDSETCRMCHTPGFNPCTQCH